MVNLYLDAEILNNGLLDTAASLFATPWRCLQNGKTYIVTSLNPAQVNEVSSFSSQDSWVFTALSIIAFIPGLLIAIPFRLAALLLTDGCSQRYAALGQPQVPLPIPAPIQPPVDPQVPVLPVPVQPQADPQAVETTTPVQAAKVNDTVSPLMQRYLDAKAQRKTKIVINLNFHHLTSPRDENSFAEALARDLSSTNYTLEIYGVDLNGLNKDISKDFHQNMKAGQKGSANIRIQLHGYSEQRTEYNVSLQQIGLWAKDNYNNIHYVLIRDEIPDSAEIKTRIKMEGIDNKVGKFNISTCTDENNKKYPSKEISFFKVGDKKTLAGDKMQTNDAYLSLLISILESK